MLSNRNYLRIGGCILLLLLGGVTGCASSSYEPAKTTTVAAQPTSVQVFVYPKAGKVSEGTYVKLEM